MMQIDSPRDLFLHELHLIYDAEHKIRELIRDTSGKIKDQGLAQMLRDHAEKMAQQIGKLERCFHELGERPQRVPCAAIDGIREDYRTVINQNPPAEVQDMAMLSTGIKIEHYEIGVYRGLTDRALLMEQTRVAQILQSILYEEEDTAAKMERISHKMSQRELVAV